MGSAALAEQSLVVPVTDLMQPGRIRRHLEELKQPVDAIATPLPMWNQQCRDEGGGVGLALGWHVIVAGSTGHGKSIMALNMAAEAKPVQASGAGRRLVDDDLSSWRKEIQS